MTEIESHGVRKLSRVQAKEEILDYLDEMGRKAYISEIAEELYIDFDLIESILEEIYDSNNEEN